MDVPPTISTTPAPDGAATSQLSPNALRPPSSSSASSPQRKSSLSVQGSNNNNPITAIKSSSNNSKTSSRNNLALSKSNLLGSKNNLANGSKGNLISGSRHGSLRNVAVAAAAKDGDRYRGIGGVIGSASSAGHTPTQAVMYENTYKMKPDRKFRSEAVKRMVDDLLTNKLSKVKYDPETTPELVKKISHEILFEVKNFEFDRYKIAVDVTIGEFTGQGIRVQSRALWDTSTDSFASSSYHNSTLFAVAMVFGLYFE